MPRTRSLPVGPVLCVLALAGGAAAQACGGGGASAPGPAGPSAARPADAGADARPARAPLPSGLPPMAEMPPPGVVGSKKAKARDDAKLYACAEGAPRSGKDPAALVKRLGEACAAASKMHAARAIVRGQASDRDPARAQTVHVEAGKCYRVYLATDEGVRDAVALLRDSAGDAVAESPAPAVPENGAVCFTAADDVTLMIAVGSGKGAYAAQVWSD